MWRKGWEENAEKNQRSEFIDCSCRPAATSGHRSQGHDGENAKMDVTSCADICHVSNLRNASFSASKTNRSWIEKRRDWSKPVSCKVAALGFRSRSTGASCHVLRARGCDSATRIHCLQSVGWREP